MRDCQIEAVRRLEESFAQNRPRALIHMATGAGKTFTACAFIYRLIKHATHCPKRLARVSPEARPRRSRAHAGENRGLPLF